MTQEKIDSLRTAVIVSDTNTPILEALITVLPEGYSLEKLPENARSKIAPDRTHVIKTPSQDEIHLRNSEGGQKVTTSNVINQDTLEVQPILADDELSKLAVLLNKTGVVSMQVMASNNELKG
ncbi:conserved hypothetical protein [Acinetobacter proteolyticus]|jgi:hypothetical protein|uniref:Uncharacterized protein n=1 Tax=Acinetobacter proteolyticus TaxID=1776741 RepID=A0A653KAF1_9GAMM|nr:hypothetical protein [Acinetobacter proteolyticus]VXA57464.1 conserved hypothetical protein [Acinetobacter proteolyticus]